MSGNLLTGAGYVDIKGTGTSHTSSFQRILLPPTRPAIGPFHFPPGLAHLHHHQPPRGPALSTPLLSRVHREDDAYFTMDTNSPNTLFPFFSRLLRSVKNGRKTGCGSLSRSKNCLMLQSPHRKTEITVVPTVTQFNEVKHVKRLSQSLVQKRIGGAINNNIYVIINM